MITLYYTISKSLSSSFIYFFLFFVIFHFVILIVFVFYFLSFFFWDNFQKQKNKKKTRTSSCHVLCRTVLVIVSSVARSSHTGRHTYFLFWYPFHRFKVGMGRSHFSSYANIFLDDPLRRHWFLFLYVFCFAFLLVGRSMIGDRPSSLFLPHFCCFLDSHLG